MTSRLLIWVCMVLGPASAFAQGTISGVATDTSRAVLPGVAVELTAPGTQFVRTATTNAAGRYEFRDVGPGTYSVTFTLPGFNTLKREGVVLAPGASAAAVDAVLRVGALQEKLQLPRRPPSTPDGPRCLHNENETASERERREEALSAMRMIDNVLRTFPGTRIPPPSWEDVSESVAVRRMRSQGNELALTIRWGTSEPLPGWRIEWGKGRNGAVYALVDMRDPCAFTYSSEDPEVTRRYRRQLL